MYVSSIKFKRTKDSKWESGYYIGEAESSRKSTILDKNYKPVPEDEKGCAVWDYCISTDPFIQLRCNN